MSSFPLPTGECRVICRPNRTKPRRVGIPAVVRFAQAAVRDGAAPCEVVEATAEGVGCLPCQELIPELTEALDAALEARDQLTLGLDRLYASVGLSRPADTEESLFRAIRRRLEALIRIFTIIGAMIQVAGAAEDAEAVLDGLAVTLREVFACIRA